MKDNRREIVIFTIAALATLSAVWYFFGNIEKKKIVAQTDLFTLIAPAPEAVLSVNRPDIFARYILSDSSAYKAFSSYIPDFFLSIVRQYPALPDLMFSFHPQGVLFYAKITGSQLSKIEKKDIKNAFGSFAPQKQKKGIIDFIFYPDTGNRFLGYYHHNGIWVASYSRKLLEEVARLQTRHINHPLPAQNKLRRISDRSSPLSLMFRPDCLDLRTPLSDSTEWSIQDDWIETDIFISKGALCYYGSSAYQAGTDSVYTALEDTLSLRLERLFPHIHFQNQITIEDGQLLFTGCNLKHE